MKIVAHPEFSGAMKYAIPVFPSLKATQASGFIKASTPREVFEALAPIKPFPHHHGADLNESKKQAPLFCMGVVRSDLPNGASQTKSEAHAGYQGLAFDVDSANSEQIEDFDAKLRERGWGHMKYTTAKHTQENPRVRYLLLFDRLAKGGSYFTDKLWGGMQKLSGGIGDPGAKDAGRRSFWHSCPKGQESTRPPAEIVDGRAIDPAELAAIADATDEVRVNEPDPLPKAGVLPPKTNPFGSLGYEPPSVVNDGEGREATVLRYAGHLRAMGKSQDDIESELLQFNNQSVHPPLPDDVVLDRARRYANKEDSLSGSQSGTEPNKTAPSPTDLVLSVVFVRLNTGALKYNHSSKNWTQFVGGRWAPCAKGEQVEKFKGVTTYLVSQAATRLATDPDGSAAKKYTTLALRAQSEKNITSALKLAQSDGAMACTSDEFDTNADLFNVANGVVDLKTYQLLPHYGEQMLTKQSPVLFDPDAQCPLFLKFLEQISLSDPDWIDYLQRTLGYALCGSVAEEKMFFWFGDGRNGKSVLVNVIYYIMGDYAGVATAGMFMVSHKDGDAATPQLAMLPGKRFIGCNETEAGSRLSAQTLKVAVSTEPIAARRLYGGIFTFNPSHKVFMRGNHLPIIREGDEGTWRRIDFVPFDLKLTPAECDYDLEKKLKAEASGILNWLLEGHAKWRKHGLKPAARVRAVTNKYREASDLLLQWLTDECTVDPTAEVEKFIAYTNYRQWASANGLHGMSKKALTQALAERGYQDKRQTSGVKRVEVYCGFRCN